MSNFKFRKATKDDISSIWIILQQAIQRRKNEGSQQWQDGYPNLNSIQNDIEKEAGFVLSLNDEIVAYSAVILNNEPAYDEIEGNWLTEGDFYVIHRVAVEENFLGKGIANFLFEKIEELAISQNIFSIKVDTNFDNFPMLHIFEKRGYQYCGEVYFRGSARKAFEKVLLKNSF